MIGESGTQLKDIPGDNIMVENYIATAIGYKLVEDSKLGKVVKTARLYLNSRGFFVDDAKEASPFSDPRAAHDFLHSCPMEITPTNGYKLVPHTVSFRQVLIKYFYKVEEGKEDVPVLCFYHTLSNKFVDSNGNEIRRSIEANGSLRGDEA